MILLLCCLTFLVFPAKVYTQTDFEAYTRQKLWPQIDSTLKAEDFKGDFASINQQIVEHCKEDVNCLKQTYKIIINNLENNFDLDACIFLCQQILQNKALVNNPTYLGKVYYDISRFYLAIRFEQPGIIYLDSSLLALERSNDEQLIAKVKMFRLEMDFKYRPYEEVFKEMEALIRESESNRNKGALLILRARIIPRLVYYRFLDDAMRHIEALEGMIPSDSLKTHEIQAMRIAARGRAQIANIGKQLDSAEYYSKKVLESLKLLPDRWIELRTYDDLTFIEWDRGNRQKAKYYVDTALYLARQHNLKDQLIRILESKEYIAEAEGNYEAALKYNKELNQLKLERENRNIGFNIENYYLQSQQEKKDLALKLKEVELRNSWISVIFALLISLTLAVATYIQIKRGQKLAFQNKLIIQQARKLENLDASKSRFFANVSHEFRTPLSLILGPVGSLLKNKNLTDRQAQMLTLAHKNGNQLMRLIDEILDLTQLEMGKMAVNLKEVELSSFFSRYLTQFESMAEHKRIRYDYTIHLKLRTTALIDKEKIRQILNNLISNAFKYTPSGESIEVDIAALSSQLIISVRDTGPGIAQEDLPHLFDRYFQTNRPDKPAEGGTGIGLAICKEYTDLFDGEISVNSKVGEGSLFSVKIPIEYSNHFSYQLKEIQKMEESVAYESHTSQPVAHPSAIHGKILVVEDNQELLEYIKLILPLQYDIQMVNNGKEALDCLDQSSDFDLIISDLMMPVMDGFQLLEKVKNNDTTRHLPFIMLTARADLKDKLKALRIGVDDYLLKPFVEEELIARVNNLIQNKKQRQQYIEESKNEIIKPTEAISEEDKNWLENFEAFTKESLGRSTMNVATLANHFAMSESTLLRQLKRITGLTTTKYLQEIKLNKARQLLEEKQFNTVSRTAYESGYKDEKAFSKAFKKRFGILPSDLLGYKEKQS